MAANDAIANLENRDTNWAIWNKGTTALTGFNFMLRVEGLFDLPCRAVKGFQKEEEYEIIQEGGVNDYVHSLRKPISKPFTLEVERYVGVDYVDPLPLGAEPILPILLFVSTKPIGTSLQDAIRTYTFTGCKVKSKDFGELNAENSSLIVERTTIIYRQMLYVTLPDKFFNHAIPKFEDTYKNTTPKTAATYPTFKTLTYVAMKQAGVAEVSIEDEYGNIVMKKVDDLINGYTPHKKTLPPEIIVDKDHDKKDNTAKYLSFDSYKKTEPDDKNTATYKDYKSVKEKVDMFKDNEKYISTYPKKKYISRGTVDNNNKYPAFEDVKDTLIEADNTPRYSGYENLQDDDPHRNRRGEVRSKNKTKAEMEKLAEMNKWPAKSNAKKLDKDASPETDTSEAGSKKYEAYRDLVDKVKKDVVPGKNTAKYKAFSDIETGEESPDNSAKYPNFIEVKDDNVEADNTPKYSGYGEYKEAESHRNTRGEVPTPTKEQMEALAKKNSWPQKRNAKTIASILSGDKK